MTSASSDSGSLSQLEFRCHRSGKAAYVEPPRAAPQESTPTCEASSPGGHTRRTPDSPFVNH